MLFSGKISNSVISWLEKNGHDLSELFIRSVSDRTGAGSEVPYESLRDPSQWISAPVMESFFETILKLYPDVQTEGLKESGHRSHELHSWGVLDSVLRMMPIPQEVFAQPETFISYFVSPKPPIENFQKTSHSISFDWPLPADLYPLVGLYLKSAFEGLPAYVGKPLASCDWNGISLKLEWSESAAPIFAAEENRQISPELFQALIADLHKTQEDREELKKQITDFEFKISEYEKRWASNPTAVSADPVAMEAQLNFSNDPLATQKEKYFHNLNQNLARMHDYMVRAQQLNTMLMAQLKITAPIKEIMRRVDWDFVKEQYPRTVSDSMELVRKIKKTT